MKLTLINIWIFLMLFLTMRSQDFHFSQFNENPALLNPALTGATSPMRISLNNKDQWRSISNTYRTFGASFETRFNPGSWQQVDKFRSMTFKEKSVGGFAGGFSCYTDKAGDGNFGLSQANLSLASCIQISKKSFFTVGLQASLNQRKVDNTKLIFPGQYNGSGYDANMASKETFQNSNFIYPDIATGMLWSYVDKEKKSNTVEKVKATLGFAVFHILDLRQNHLGAGNQSYKKYVVHGDLFFRLPGSAMAIAPGYLFQSQGPSNEFLIGSFLKYFLNTDSKYTGIIKRNCLGVGVHYRNKDAIIVSALLEWQEQFAVVMSYDLNISQLSSATSMRGGFEITLRYTPPAAFLYQKKKNTAK